MKKILMSMGCAIALSAAPLTIGTQDANADNRILRGIVGGLIAGAVIGTIVRAGQHHCHQGLGCHSHGYAQANHYHQYVSGPILYYQAAPVVVQPAPAPAAYPQAHYNWCFAKYRSYDAPSNSFQPYGNRPRQVCVSPYGGW